MFGAEVVELDGDGDLGGRGDRLDPDDHRDAERDREEAGDDLRLAVRRPPARPSERMFRHGARPSHLQPSGPQPPGAAADGLDHRRVHEGLRDRDTDVRGRPLPLRVHDRPVTTSVAAM